MTNHLKLYEDRQIVINQVPGCKFQVASPGLLPGEQMLHERLAAAIVEMNATLKVIETVKNVSDRDSVTYAIRQRFLRITRFLCK